MSIDPVVLEARIQDAIDSSPLFADTEQLLRDCLAAIAAPHGETVANVLAEPGFYNAQQLKDSHRFFAYCPDIGAVWHETAEDAAQDAAMRIAGYRSAANDDGEWSDDVEEVYWGELKGRAIAKADANGTDYSLESIDVVGTKSKAAVGTTPSAGTMPSGLGMVPLEPSEEHLQSMAVRYDHGLGIPGYYDDPLYASIAPDGHAKRLESTKRIMRQLYEEAVGQGFHKLNLAPSSLHAEEGRGA
ncbi:MAG: hypothetical protein E6Q67_00835 [Roseateles sp.]|nr:MAG: hypothetical protein E6Q67_00835 [Roseateles sp.]